MSPKTQGLFLNTDQSQFFHDNGYLLIPSFYSPTEISEIRQHFHQLVTHTDERPQNYELLFHGPCKRFSC